MIHEITEKGTPFLGICLGLQLLFESSDETPGVEGLGILKGKFLRIPPSPGLKIPHMGWNSLHIQNDGRLFKGYSGKDICIFCTFLLSSGRGEQIVKRLHSIQHIHASVEKGKCICMPVPSGKEQPVRLKILENFAALEAGTGKEEA